MLVVLLGLVASSCFEQIAGPPDDVIVFGEPPAVVIRRCTEDIEDVEVFSWSEDEYPDSPSGFPGSARITPSVRSVDGRRVLVVSGLPSDSRDFVVFVRASAGWSSYRIQLGEDRSSLGRDQYSGAAVSRSSAEASCRS